MNNSPRLTVRIDADVLNGFDAYCQANNIKRSEGVRIAIERLCKSKPTNGERERAAFPMGRPTDAD
jgi:metal-responsive CopG/Arc/MetJ family transcriptional regulator